MRRWVGFLLIALVVGCGKGGAGSKNASSNSSGHESSSKENGKVYTSTKKSGSKGSGGGTETPLPQPADTADSKASPASDEGSVDASKGLPVLNPGAPPANKSQGAPKGSH